MRVMSEALGFLWQLGAIGVACCVVFFTVDNEFVKVIAKVFLLVCFTLQLLVVFCMIVEVFKRP